MEFQRKWRKIDREFQRAAYKAYNSKITVSTGWVRDCYYRLERQLQEGCWTVVTRSHV